MRIAVIGSGIAGLAACWWLSQRHQVTLFEAADGIGMDAHSLDAGAGVRVDVPLRVFHDGYYPTLTELYREAGVRSAPVDSSASFSTSSGELLFRYGNIRVGKLAIPWLTNVGLMRPTVVRTGLEAGRMLLVLGRERARADVRGGITFGEYLSTAPFTEQFVQTFLLPAVAGIATCSYASIRQFPASTVLAYLDSPRTHSMRRALHGTRDVATRLSAGAAEVHLSTAVQSVVRHERDVSVHSPRGEQRFDHAVFATEAPRVSGLLDATGEERSVLERFRYERSVLVVHTDDRLAPRDRRWWSPVNYILSSGEEAPMTTVVLSAIHTKEWVGPPLFQTWNPIVSPAPSSVLAEVPVERALVDSRTAGAVRTLRKLHDEPDRRVWFCGSYANDAMTLQESAVSSALAVVKAIEARAAGA